MFERIHTPLSAIVITMLMGHLYLPLSTCPPIVWTEYGDYLVMPHKDNIQVETELKGDGKRSPFILVVRIINTSEKAVELTSGALLLDKYGATQEEMEKLRGNYWAPLNLQKLLDDKCSNRRNTVTILPHESLSFRVSLDELRWGPNLSSVYPNQFLKKVAEPGVYNLRLSLIVAGEKTQVNSQPVLLSISK